MTGGSMILVCAAACRQRIAGNNSIFSRQMPGSRTLWRVRQAKHNSMLRLWLAIVTSNRINPRCVIKARSPLLGGSLNSRDEKDDNVSRRDPSEIICDFNCSKFNRNSWNSSRRYVIYNLTLLLLKIFLKFNILLWKNSLKNSNIAESWINIFLRKRCCYIVSIERIGYQRFIN